jgi:hypothetical protein
MNDLSERLFAACNRMGDAVTEFYDEIHPEGEPDISMEDLSHLISDLKYYIRLELDLVKDLFKEEHELG